MTSPEQIAKGLGEGERRLVLDLSGAWKLCTVDEARPLNRLGLTDGRKTDFGYAVRLLKPGLAVRAYLLEQDPAK